MKTIKLKSVRMCSNPTATEDEQVPEILLVWRDEIVRLLMTPKAPERGTDYIEMDSVMNLIKKLQEFEMPDLGDGELQVEDEEHHLIVERLMTARFRFNSPEIYDMINTIANLTKESPTQQRLL